MSWKSANHATNPRAFSLDNQHFGIDTSFVGLGHSFGRAYIATEIEERGGSSNEP